MQDISAEILVKELTISSGKTPPNVVDFEKLVLGTVLIESHSISRVMKRLGTDADVFYDPRHQVIYEAMCFLQKKDQPIDLMTVIQELKRIEKIALAGGDYYVIELSMAISSSANLDYHLMMVLEKFLSRKMINICANTIGLLYRDSTDMFDVFSKHTEGVNMVEEIIAAQQETLSSLELHKQLIQQQREKVIPGIPSKHRSVEKEMHGWRNGNLVIIGGRPAMGKTTFVLDDVFHAAKTGVPVAFFSLEMSAIELHSKMVSNETEIPGNAFRDLNLSDMEMQRVFETNVFDNLPFYIEDKLFELNKILAKARLLKKEKGVKMIVIDYLQLIELPNSNGMNDNSKISVISRRLKLLAKELDLPVIVLSQLSRKVEERPSKRPMLSDLRDSGAIEQDADVVGFLYRPEYYKIATWDNDPDGEETSTKNEAEFICAKFRGGSVFESRLKFRGDFSKFYDKNTDFGSYQNRVPLGDPGSAFEEDDDFKY